MDLDSSSLALALIAAGELGTRVLCTKLEACLADTRGAASSLHSLPEREMEEEVSVGGAVCQLVSVCRLTGAGAEGSLRGKISSPICTLPQLQQPFFCITHVHKS